MPKKQPQTDQVDYKAVAEQLATENAQLADQINQLTDLVQRERADATNVRRRAEEEKVKLGTFYKSLVVRELLPVIDNFERALKNTPSELVENDYIKGVQGVVKQFEAVLTKLGVERIKTVGETFDPELHEAVSMEDDGDGTKEIVTEELQAGYRLQDEVLRHAMVRVGLG